MVPYMLLKPRPQYIFDPFLARSQNQWWEPNRIQSKPHYTTRQNGQTIHRQISRLIYRHRQRDIKMAPHPGT